MASKGGSLVVCGLAPELQRLFSITMLDQILDIKDSAADALKALG
jgi:anti-anti-sigma regulatory factor